jgi:hypothetical protein
MKNLPHQPRGGRYWASAESGDFDYTDWPLNLDFLTWSGLLKQPKKAQG